jgi:hypothetical protein
MPPPLSAGAAPLTAPPLRFMAKRTDAHAGSDKLRDWKRQQDSSENASTDPTA